MTPTAPPTRRPIRPARTALEDPGTVYRSSPRRAAIAAWWRYRPNPVGTALVLLLCLYLGGVSYAYWAGPWTWVKSAVVCVAGSAALHLAAAAVWWARRWHQRNP